MATLRAERGPVAGQSLQVTRSPFTVGRSDDNDLVLADTPVSRHHARLEQQGGRWYLHDSGSSNGTFLNGQRLVSPQPLHTGDEIGIGESLLVFQAELSPPLAAGPSEPFAGGGRGVVVPRAKAKPRRSRSRMVVAIALGVVLLGLLVVAALILHGQLAQEEKTPGPELPGSNLPTIVFPTGLPTTELPIGIPSLEIPPDIPTGLSLPTGLPPLPSLGVPQAAQGSP